MSAPTELITDHNMFKFTSHPHKMRYVLHLNGKGNATHNSLTEPIPFFWKIENQTLLWTESLDNGWHNWHTREAEHLMPSLLSWIIEVTLLTDI